MRGLVFLIGTIICTISKSQYPEIDTIKLADNSIVVSYRYETEIIDSIHKNDNISVIHRYAYEIPFDSLIKNENLQIKIRNLPDYFYLCLTDALWNIDTIIVVYDTSFITLNKGLIYYHQQKGGLYKVDYFDDKKFQDIIDRLNSIMVFNLAEWAIEPEYSDNCVITTNSRTTKIDIKINSNSFSCNKKLNFIASCAYGPHLMIPAILWQSELIHFPDNQIDWQNDFKIIEQNQEFIKQNMDLNLISRIMNF